MRSLPVHAVYKQAPPQVACWCRQVMAATSIRADAELTDPGYCLDAADVMPAGYAIGYKSGPVFPHIGRED